MLEKIQEAKEHARIERLEKKKDTGTKTRET
jgi:hypothetical protein